jgi:hypothetical protein
MTSSEDNLHQETQVVAQPEPTQETTENTNEVLQELNKPESSTLNKSESSNVDIEPNLAAKNFKALSQAKKKIEEERDFLASKLKDYESRAQTSQTDDTEYDTDTSKLAKEVKELKEQLKHTTTITTESRIKTNHPDFDTVVTKDNIDILRESYPEVAATLNSSPDLYTKAVAAYTMIKKLGIVSVDYSQDHEKIDRNLKKPRPTSSLSSNESSSPLSQVNLFSQPLTEEVRKQIYKQMIENSK